MIQTGVLVISSTKEQLMPTSERHARILLKQGKAAVLKRFPFTIILKDRESGILQPISLKLDPGSKQTGIALINDVTHKVIFAMELHHRGLAIKMKLLSRKALRSGRRSRKTRYRKPGLPNTRKPEGWIAPSLLHRVLTVETWMSRLRRYTPITTVSIELNKFDTQLMQNADISGIEYQQGTLQGYEIREYLLEKWERKCTYCDKENVPLQIEHIHCRAKNGSDRANNLALACKTCNDKKGTQDIRDFLKNKPDLLAKILKQAKTPLHDAAAVNTTRWALYKRLKATGLPVETGTGGHTKFNRIKQEYPKAHWIDAACVGKSGEHIIIPKGMTPLIAKATGHGNRQMCGTDKYGFPKGHRTNQKTHFGFQTGNIVKATIPTGKHKGIHTGKISCRATGYFDISTTENRIQGIKHNHCTIIHHPDGYNYSKRETHSSHLKKFGLSVLK